MATMNRIGFLCGTLIAVAIFGSTSILAADQFYANNDGVYGWSVEPRKKLKTTTWFVKNPADSSTYEELTAVLYDAKPSYVYYLDKVQKRVVGRLDLETEKFSLVPAAQQRVRQSLDKFDFPPAAALPRTDAMFDSLSDEQATSRNHVQMPPPTFQFPQLEQSEWESCYMSADRFLIRCLVRLNGNTGTYELQDKPGTGRLSDVAYEKTDDEHIVRGNWNLGQSRGNFTFKIPAENLNAFWGDFGFQPGKTVGAWSGIRRPHSASTRVRKPVR